MEQNHIIDKVIIEVSVGSKEKAYEIKDNISSFLKMEVFPKLEKYFNTTLAELQTHTLQIEELSILLNEKQSSLNTALKDAIVETFTQELNEVVKAGPYQNGDAKKEEILLLGKEERLVETFIYFLENGYMPWWTSNEKSVEILETKAFNKIISAKIFESKFAYSLKKTQTQERIINQLTDHQIISICQLIIKTKGLKIILSNTIVKQLYAKSLDNRKTIWLLIFDIIITSFINTESNIDEYITKQAVKTIYTLKTIKNQNSEEEIWKQITAVFTVLKQYDYNTIRQKYLEENKRSIESNKDLTRKTSRNHTVLNKKKEDKPTDDNGYHVQNAGLVLIHPFINNLFRYCNLIDEDTQKLTNPEVCAHLLHYIATGKTGQPESNMLFEKFLCNIPVHESINRHIKLSEKQKDEAAKVIAAVQENWSPMKKSSVGLIQNEFFQRHGKLIVNDNPALTIEKKTQDIFLNKLSWGISYIKLPWQSTYIYVNW